MGDRERAVGTQTPTGSAVRFSLVAILASTTGVPLIAQESRAPSSAWLARLPDGVAKRKFILDCTGCHQFDQKIARVGGRPRTETEWAEAVTRMLGYAGARTGFPVIAADRDPQSTAAWLTKYLGSGGVQEPKLPSQARAEITEFLMPEPERSSARHRDRALGYGAGDGDVHSSPLSARSRQRPNQRDRHSGGQCESACDRSTERGRSGSTATSLARPSSSAA